MSSILGNCCQFPITQYQISSAGKFYRPLDCPVFPVQPHTCRSCFKFSRKVRSSTQWWQPWGCKPWIGRCPIWCFLIGISSVLIFAFFFIWCNGVSGVSHDQELWWETTTVGTTGPRFPKIIRHWHYNPQRPCMHVDISIMWAGK